MNYKSEKIKYLSNQIDQLYGLISQVLKDCNREEVKELSCLLAKFSGETAHIREQVMYAMHNLDTAEERKQKLYRYLDRTKLEENK